jgi:hypothetical protein
MLILFSQMSLYKRNNSRGPSRDSVRESGMIALDKINFPLCKIIEVVKMIVKEDLRGVILQRRIPSSENALP